MTMYNDRLLVRESILLGVSAYLPKESAPEEIERCLKNYSQREEIFQRPGHPKASQRQLRINGKLRSSLDNLTRMEKAVLQGVSQSLSSKEIAEKLGVKLSHG